MRDDGFEYVDGSIGTLRRKIAALPRAGIDHANAAVGHRERGEPRQCSLIQTFGPLVFRQIEPVGRQRLLDRAAARGLPPLAPRLLIIPAPLEALSRCVLALPLGLHRRAPL